VLYTRRSVLFTTLDAATKLCIEVDGTGTETEIKKVLSMIVILSSRKKKRLLKQVA
jgi:hypothetical protein